MTDRIPTGAMPSGRPRAARSLRRRAVLLGGLLATGGALVACAGGVPRPTPAPTTAPLPTPTPTPTPSPPTPTPTPTPAALLPTVPDYAVLPGEVEPACKQAAVAFVTEVLTTGTPGAGSVTLEARLGALGQALGPAAPLLDLLPAGGASALEVVYPQYGGLTGDLREASVMLVANQLVVSGDTDRTVHRRSTTVDVRLRAGAGTWRITEARPAAVPASAHSLSPAVQALLATDRVVLPAAARADLLGGGVHDIVAVALTELSQHWRIHVQVLTAGHPGNVFATDKVSNHTRGKAVDIWALDGVPVIDQGRCPWRKLMEAGSAAGATEVGGPVDDGSQGHFTDHVHQDHVHLGFGKV